jgi:hypothetical protein
VADDIVPRREFSWQDSGDFEVVLDERVGYPGSWADNGGLADLGPFEGGGDEGRAVTCNLLAKPIRTISVRQDVPLQGAM